MVILILHRTTYVGQVMAQELGQEPDHDLATRRGELAMLIYSVGASNILSCVLKYSSFVNSWRHCRNHFTSPS
jgi:hypothetical protein